MITKRMMMLGGLSAVGVGALFSASQAQVSRRPFAPVEPWAAKLIDAAKSQIGVTTIYDPSYQRLDFPMGDIPRKKGVCTDVIIRAYRDAYDIDLQALINADMKAHFSTYPKIWGLKRTDKNIDHRRVPNIERYFERRGLSLPLSDNPTDFLPGDIVTQRLPRNLPHIGIVTSHASIDGQRPMMVHNIGAGAQLEDRIFDFNIVGHFRATPDRLV